MRCTATKEAMQAARTWWSLLCGWVARLSLPLFGTHHMAALASARALDAGAGHFALSLQPASWSEQSLDMNRLGNNDVLFSAANDCAEECYPDPPTVR